MKRLRIDLPSAQNSLVGPQQSGQGLGAPERPGFPSECREVEFYGEEEVRGRRKEGLSGFADIILFSMGRSQDKQASSFIGEEHGLGVS